MSTIAKRLTVPDLEPVGPGTPVGRYLRLFWRPVLRAQELRPKQAKPIEILGEKFTIYRGDKLQKFVEGMVNSNPEVLAKMKATLDQGCHRRKQVRSQIKAVRACSIRHCPCKSVERS